MAEITEILARIEALEEENATLHRRLDQLSASAPVPRTFPDEHDREVGRGARVSRRLLLRGAGASAAAIGVGALATAAHPIAVRATDDQPVLASNNNTATGDTTVTSSGQRGLVGRTSSTGGVDGNNHTASGVVGIAFNAKGNNFDDAPSGVLGIVSNASGFNVGVQGVASSSTGVGVAGRATEMTGETVGVFAEADSPNGRGVWAIAGLVGVEGDIKGDTKGAVGVTGSAIFPGQIGVAGYSEAGIGVLGSATLPGGRGGVFFGTAAQLRLQPSTAKSHPHSGRAGDLFIDSSKRLWLCKGSTTWHLLG